MDRGNPGIAILGVTQLVKQASVASDVGNRHLQLAQKWDCFQKLDARDQEIAVATTQGASCAEIATRYSITKRTVENRRALLLESMKLETPLDLIKLIVRFQECGLGDFRV